MLLVRNIFVKICWQRSLKNWVQTWLEAVMVMVVDINDIITQIMRSSSKQLFPPGLVRTSTRCPSFQWRSGTRRTWWQSVGWWGSLVHRRSRRRRLNCHPPRWHGDLQKTRNPVRIFHAWPDVNRDWCRLCRPCYCMFNRSIANL